MAADFSTTIVGRNSSSPRSPTLFTFLENPSWNGHVNPLSFWQQSNACSTSSSTMLIFNSQPLTLLLSRWGLPRHFSRLLIAHKRYRPTIESRADGQSSPVVFSTLSRTFSNKPSLLTNHRKSVSTCTGHCDLMGQPITKSQPRNHHGWTEIILIIRYIYTHQLGSSVNLLTGAFQ